MGNGPKFPREMMAPEVERLVELLGRDRVVVCGSYRRGCSKMGDIDLVSTGVTVEDLQALGLRLVHPGNPRNEFAMDVSWSKRPIKVDLWTPVEGRLGSCVLHATGSGLHNVLMRRWAISRGLRFDWLGVRDGEGNVLAAATEEECCLAMGWPFHPPEMRENVLSWATPIMEKLNDDRR